MAHWKSSDLHNTTKAKKPKEAPKHYTKQLEVTDVQDALSAISINRKASIVEYDVDGKYVDFTLKDGSQWRVTLTKVN